MEELTWWRMDEMSGKFSLVYNNVADNSIKCGFKDDDDSSSVFVDSLFFLSLRRYESGFSPQSMALNK